MATPRSRPRRLQGTHAGENRDRAAACRDPRAFGVAGGDALAASADRCGVSGVHRRLHARSASNAEAMTPGTCAVIALTLLAARAAESQARSALEVRVDGIAASRVTTVHLGVGGTRVVSRNLEVQIVIGAGSAFRDGSSDDAAAGRADLLARFAPIPGD